MRTDLWKMAMQRQEKLLSRLGGTFDPPFPGRAWPWNKVLFLDFSNRVSNIPQSTQWLDVIMTDVALWFQSTFEDIISVQIWCNLLISPLHRYENRCLVRLNAFVKITQNLILSLLAAKSDSVKWLYGSLSWPFVGFPWNANNRNSFRFTWSLD